MGHPEWEPPESAEVRRHRETLEGTHAVRGVALGIAVGVILWLVCIAAATYTVAMHPKLDSVCLLCGVALTFGLIHDASARQ
jgi:hypothetical protein